jgi:hypothetical protein
MNILEAEDIIKGLPDQSLMQEAQAPSGQVPQFLVVSEIQRRTDMRKRYQDQQQPQGTVTDQIVQEGIMGAMPPQPMMPQAMPPQAMPPQAMPPQQMFGGGIIRLQEGGFLDQQTVSGAGDVRSQIERAIAEGASMADLLTIFKNQPEAIELVKQLVADRQRASVSQYNPLLDEGVSDLDKAFIASERAKDIVADQIGSRFNYFQPPEIVGDMVEGAVNAYRSMPSMDDLVSSFRDMAQEQNPDYSMIAPAGLGISMDDLPSLPEGAGSNIPEMFQSGRNVNAQLASLPSLPEGAGSNTPEMFQSGRDTNTQLASLPDLGQTDVALPARSRGEGIASARESYVPNLPDFQLPQMTEQERRAIRGGVGSVFDLIFGVPERPDYEVAREVATVRPFDQAEAKPGQVDAPKALKDALELAQEGTQDASRKGAGILYEEDGIGALLRGGPKEVQGTSPRQAQAVPDPGKPDALDFSDLIKESKDAAMANALMQLGAGIAGGDLSKGISAAGIAATKGQQDARAMAIRKRLSEYQAGREDQARGEEIDLKREQYGKSLLQTSLSSIPDMIRQKGVELASLRSYLPEDDLQIQAIVQEIKNLTNQYNTLMARAASELNDFSGYRVVSTSGA